MAKQGSKFNKYSYEFKLTAVEDYLSGNYGGMLQVCRKHGIKSKTQLKNWLKIYNDDPKSLAIDNRGKAIGAGRPKTIRLNEMSLEQQNEYLKMENDILKKLKALLQK